jgi:uncharacterized membrane protein YjjP (DUF1212 family)
MTTLRQSEPTGAELDDLQQFLLVLGSALTAAGEAVNEIQENLRRVAVAYGFARARITILPTFSVVALEPTRPATLEPTEQLRGVLRLDQTAALFELLKQAQRAEVPPREGSERIGEIVAMRPRFGPAVTILGHVVLTIGICLVLQPTWGDLGLAAVFGALVGAMKLVGVRWTSVQMIMPVVAAFSVASITYLLADQGWADADLRAMIAPLVTFLPGATLTIAVVEISAADMISGASRLVTGFLQLALLAFGIVAAAQLVALPSADSLVNDPENPLGWWAPWLGVLVVGIGSFVYHSAPRGSLAWLLVVLYAAWIGQALGNEALGGYLSGFVGALVMTPVAYIVERVRSGPPALVSFLPAFWLLVPGALSLIGLTEYVADDPAAGLQDLLNAVGSILSIALGVLCGYPLYRSLARSYQRLGGLRPG